MISNKTQTKIVATLGPASSTRSVLKEMLAAGVSVARINGAHGSPDEHKRTIALVRNISKRLKITVAILIDLPGPKYRIGKLARESEILKPGNRVILACESAVQRGREIPVPHNIRRTIKRGHMVYINDGIVALRVTSVRGKKIECVVKAGGEIRSHKGLNLPDTKLLVPALTAQDKTILDFAIKQDVDYVGLSFVRSARHVKILRNILKRRSPHIGIISKIEKPEALGDLDNIIDASDAIMIARGDLGIEMPFDELPQIQKHIIERCRSIGKPSITATQMLESMVISARPTRAEVTDVAGAVWEGSDAVMLSEETSIGGNPVQAVEAMSKIARTAEKQISPLEGTEVRGNTRAHQAQIISAAGGLIAQNLNARAIVAPTRSGRTPLFLSQCRLDIPIVAPTEDVKIARRMCLYWGVMPMVMPRFKTVDEMLSRAERIARKSGFIKRGDTIVIVSGAHGKKGDITKLVEVRRV